MCGLSWWPGKCNDAIRRQDYRLMPNNWTCCCATTSYFRQDRTVLFFANILAQKSLLISNRVHNFDSVDNTIS